MSITHPILSPWPPKFTVYLCIFICSVRDVQLQCSVSVWLERSCFIKRQNSGMQYTEYLISIPGGGRWFNVSPGMACTEEVGGISHLGMIANISCDLEFLSVVRLREQWVCQNASAL